MLNYLILFITSLLFSLIFITLLNKLAAKTNLLSPQGVTYLGGLGIWLALVCLFIAGILIYGYLHRPNLGILFGSSLIVFFGLADDYKKELTVPIKFLVQVLATIVLVSCGVRTQIVYIGSFWNLVITFIWVIGITNALNHLDIMDGLAAGIAAIAAATFFLVALLNNNFSVAIAGLALTGVILGFLRFNLFSAKVYMGNSGSHFLGFALAAIAITINYAPLERKIALVSPILILGLPILDTSVLMLSRIKKGRSIFKKSDDHFVLRLLARGHPEKKILILMYLIALFFGLSGLIITKVCNP